MSCLIIVHMCDLVLQIILSPPRMCSYGAHNICEDRNVVLHPDCFKTDSGPSCISRVTKDSYNLSIAVRILNTTRCAIITSVIEPTAPYCDDYMDQTNCSDPERGVLRLDYIPHMIGLFFIPFLKLSLTKRSMYYRCKVGGYPSTISKYIICSPYVDVVLCDGGEDGMCETPSQNCR